MDVCGIEYLGIDRVLKRGSGEIIASQDDALLVRDSVSGAYLLACEDPTDDTGLTVRAAGESDLPMLVENYDLVSPEELAQIVRRQKMLLGYDGERLIGFMGEHLEGSMGLLYVFPEYRHKGFGAALQRHLMARTMEDGFVPFGQVEKDNLASLRLQAKLGMTQSERLIVWMWK